MNPFTIALAQHACSDDPEINWQIFEHQTRLAASSGAQLMVSQELFTTLYFCQGQEARHFDLAEPMPGPSTDRLCALARSTGLVLVGSFFEARGPGLHHNTAAVADADGTLLGIYRKMHIPQDPGFDEKYYFASGDLGFRVFDTTVGRIGVLICWDQWFPEAARLVALQGAQILLYPTAIGWDDQEDHSLRPIQYNAWQITMRAHAIANGVYVAASNRVGHEGRLTFWGGSFVSDPQGRLLACADHGSDGPLLAACDLDAVSQTRRVWPFLRDRRIDSYSGLLRLWDDGSARR